MGAANANKIASAMHAPNREPGAAPLEWAEKRRAAATRVPAEAAASHCATDGDKRFIMREKHSRGSPSMPPCILLQTRRTARPAQSEHQIN